MAEARQRTTGRHVSWLFMVGLVVGCMSSGGPKRPIDEGTGGEGPDDPEPPKADASAPTKKMDAKPADPTSMPPPDAAPTLTPDVGVPPDVKESPPDTAAPAPDTAPAAPTFSELWMTVFGTPAMQTSSCAGAACHNPGVKDNVSFASKESAYTSLTRARGPVVKGDPAMSKLITRLTSTNVNQRMPLGKPALSKDLIDKVRAWIAAGAKND